jgi:hypothetical protein
VFWGNSVDAGRLFVLQKSCIRAICNMRQRESCVGVFGSLGILTLPSMYILECAVFVKMYYKDFFQKLEQAHNHGTRGAYNKFLLTPATHLTKAQKSALYQCVRVYNHIPERIKTLPIRQYKRELKNHLLKITLYKIENFFEIKMK